MFETFSFRYLIIEEINLGEYYALLLFATLGMMLMAATADLISLYISLELTSISLYVLVGFLKDRKSTEASLKYLLLGALGLYLAGLWGAVRRVELVGAVLWKHLQPFTRRLLPVDTVPRALALGALWGWLPCGLVYSVLLTALAAGSATQGAFVMLAFGLGTLPNLLAIGLFWERIKDKVQSPRVRLAAGVLVAGLGGYGLFKVAYTFYVHGWTGACHVAA